MEREVADKYNAFTTAGGNIVWGGALSLAWNDLKDTFNLDKIDLATENAHILTLTRNFNRCPFKPDHISQDSLYIKTGYGAETVKEINSAVKKKFPKATIAHVDFKLAPTDIIAYAYLSKTLTFKVKFEPKLENNFLFNGKPARSFWARTQLQKKQIMCHHYECLGDFVVHIPDAEGKDLMFLVKPPNPLTVDEAIATVVNMEKKGGTPLKKQDFFEMPFVDLNCQRELKEFSGVHFANSELKDYMITVVVEKMKLSIDECGAKVQNMGVVVATKSKALKKDPVIPKYIILDRTFWVVMKQPNKHPYFCAQITVPSDEGHS